MGQVYTRVASKEAAQTRRMSSDVCRAHSLKRVFKSPNISTTSSSSTSSISVYPRQTAGRFDKKGEGKIGGRCGMMELERDHHAPSRSGMRLDLDARQMTIFF